MRNNRRAAGADKETNMDRMTMIKKATEAEKNGEHLLARALNTTFETQGELEYSVNELADKARWAAERCERLARQAAEYHAALSAGEYSRPTWNSLGELQGAGVELDSLCGETMRLATVLERLLRLVEVSP